MKFSVQELRPEVLAFALLMEARLREKDADKGQSWKNIDVHRIHVAMLAKVGLLDRALYADQPSVFGTKHSVDLANYCMMISDLAGALKQDTPSQEPMEIPAFLRMYRDE